MSGDEVMPNFTNNVLFCSLALRNAPSPQFIRHAARTGEQPWKTDLDAGRWLFRQAPLHRCTYFVVLLDAPDYVWNPKMIAPEIADELVASPTSASVSVSADDTIEATL